MELRGQHPGRQYYPGNKPASCDLCYEINKKIKIAEPFKENMEAYKERKNELPPIN